MTQPGAGLAAARAMAGWLLSPPTRAGRRKGLQTRPGETERSSRACLHPRWVGGTTSRKAFDKMHEEGVRPNAVEVWILLDFPSWDRWSVRLPT